MEITRKLADFCNGIRFASLPPEVVRRCKLCVLDFVANVYGSLHLQACRSVVEAYRLRAGPASASVLGCGFRTSVRDAAFLNGMNGEAVEAQDGLRFGGNHPGAAVIPAALSLAEREGRSGREVIEAVVAGYEAANRISASVHPGHTLSGFLPTGTCGAFGAAVAAARLLGLRDERLLHALGNAGYLLPLSMAEHLMGGYTIKIVQGGQAASAAITAAELARAGLTGAPYVLEGSQLNGGFARITTTAHGPDLERITDGLGERYTILDVYFKPFTACRHTHGAAQATLELVRRRSLTPDHVEAVDVHTYGIALLAVGKGIEAGASFVSAQFSIPYVVAACLADGEFGPAQLRSDRLEDPVLLGLASRVRVHHDEALNRLYPDKTASRVEVTLHGGETLSTEVDIPKGDPRDPLDEHDVTDKLKRYASGREAADLDRAAGRILELDRIGNIADMVRSI